MTYGTGFCICFVSRPVARPFFLTEAADLGESDGPNWLCRALATAASTTAASKCVTPAAFAAFMAFIISALAFLATAIFFLAARLRPPPSASSTPTGLAAPPGMGIAIVTAGKSELFTKKFA